MRKFFHQIHLWLSIPLGILISVICLTGAILVFEKEITEIMYPETQVTQVEGHKYGSNAPNFSVRCALCIVGYSTRLPRKESLLSGKQW